MEGLEDKIKDTSQKVEIRRKQKEKEKRCSLGETTEHFKKVPEIQNLNNRNPKSKNRENGREAFLSSTKKLRKLL